MIRRFLGWASQFLRCREITDGTGDLYLERYYLWGWAPWLTKEETSKLIPWLPGAVLHRFAKSDEDREYHNHPWKWSLSVILAGGYWDNRIVDGKLRCFHMRPGRINLIRDNDFHRVDLLEKDCWTLFITGPKTQSWGFKSRETGKFTPWYEFLSKRSS